MFARILVRLDGSRLAEQAQEQGRRAAADELIAILAHDLRNHIAPIRGRIQLLQRWAAKENQVAAARHAEEIAKGIDRLNHLVSDLLDSTRLERGLFTLDRRPSDLVSLTRQVGAAMEPTADRIEVRSDAAELVALVDPDRLRQALENVLANALKFSPVAAPVTVLVAQESRAGSAWAVISVTDRGPGIPTELRRRLFERFATGPGSQGLGLGLYLARRVAEAHGGTLTVESEAGSGATFTFGLPVERP